MCGNRISLFVFICATFAFGSIAPAASISIYQSGFNADEVFGAGDSPKQFRK